MYTQNDIIIQSRYTCKYENEFTSNERLRLYYVNDIHYTVSTPFFMISFVDSALNLQHCYINNSLLKEYYPFFMANKKKLRNYFQITFCYSANSIPCQQQRTIQTKEYKTQVLVIWPQKWKSEKGTCGIGAPKNSLKGGTKCKILSVARAQFKRNGIFKS